MRTGFPARSATISRAWTDNYALEVYHALFIPRSWEVKAHDFT